MSNQNNNNRTDLWSGNNVILPAQHSYFRLGLGPSTQLAYRHSKTEINKGYEM